MVLLDRRCDTENNEAVEGSGLPSEAGAAEAHAGGGLAMANGTT